ncbi:uncharacterized mitochondrial protein-like protein [Tanacetum coccineum]
MHMDLHQNHATISCSNSSSSSSWSCRQWMLVEKGRNICFIMTVLCFNSTALDFCGQKGKCLGELEFEEHLSISCSYTLSVVWKIAGGILRAFYLFLLALAASEVFGAETEECRIVVKEAYANSTNRVSTVSPSTSDVGQSFINADDLPTDPLMPDLEDTTDLLNIGIFSGAYDDEDVGVEVDLNNLETTMNVSHIPITRIYKDHPKDQVIRDINPATQTRRMQISIRYMLLIVKSLTLVDYIMKGKRVIATKWVYRKKKDKRGIVVRNKARLVAHGYTQEEGIDYDEVFALIAKIEMMHKRFQMNSMGELTFFLGFQVQQKEDGIFISQDKYVADILKKFDFTTVKAASTPIETNKALLKDEEAEDVDVH